MPNPTITRKQAAVTQAISATLTSLSYAGKLHPVSRSWHVGVERYSGIPYKDGFRRQHTLDVYCPERRDGPLPVVFYIHGGGFGLLSKDTHWMFGYGFARQGYLVVSIDYTLSGEAPFPAAVQDTFAAWRWAHDNVVRYGGDPNRMVIAGESAGANLSLALTVAQCWERPEPWAKDVWDLAGERGVAKAVLPACGMLEVSNPERYLKNEKLPMWMRDRIAVVCRRYLPDPGAFEDLGLADPLALLESGSQPERPLPPIFSACGTRDVVKDDSRRLAEALKNYDTPGEVAWYRGGIHAFHAFIWTKTARAAWDDQLRFLDKHV